MSTGLVVVIAGVFIAVIAVATLSGDPQPATGSRRARRDRERRPVAPAEEAPLADPEPDERGLLRRARSALLLIVTVVLLGSLTAGLLGAVVVVGARALNRALG